LNLKVNWKKLSISLFLIVLAFGTYSAYRVFSSPSGQISSIEGGGFCAGDFTVYNNTIDKLLYGQNCSTGVNDVAASTDLGATVNTLFGELAALHRAGSVYMRGGYFSEVTSIIMSNGTPCYNGAIVIQCSGFSLYGSGQGGTIPSSANATMIVAKTSGMTMIKSTATPASNAPSIWGTTLSNFQLVANNLATTGINLQMSEAGGSHNRIERITITEFQSQQPNCVGGFTTGIIFDGSEDSVIDGVQISGDGQTGAGHCSATVGIQWLDANGNVNIQNTLSNAATDLVTQAQTVSLVSDTISSIKINGLTRMVSIVNSYLCNTAPSALTRIKLNGQTVENLEITGSCVELDSTVQNFYSGTGTVSVFSSNSCDWNFPSGTNVWNSGGATLTKQVTNGANHVHTNTNPATGFPFTVDGNGNF